MMPRFVPTQGVLLVWMCSLLLSCVGQECNKSPSDHRSSSGTRLVQRGAATAEALADFSEARGSRRRRRKSGGSGRRRRTKSGGGSSGGDSSKRPNVVSLKLDWETGTLDSGLAEPLKPSFSIGSSSWVPPKNPYGKTCLADPSNKNCWPASIGKTYVDGGKRVHSVSVKERDWARDGTHVLMVYADGRHFQQRGKDYPKRSELSAVQSEYVFLNGDHHYFTMSLRPDRSWDEASKYSIVIVQWKMSPGEPHAELRLSNMGDYKLFFRSKDLWKPRAGQFIGYAPPDQWTDVKVYFKKSLGKDGVVKVWLNGAKVFDHEGPTLTRDTGKGYTKWGMYTQIRNERTLYFDAVRFCHAATKEPCLQGKSFEEWVADQGSAASTTQRQVATGFTTAPASTTSASSNDVASTSTTTAFSSTRATSAFSSAASSTSAQQGTSLTTTPCPEGKELAKLKKEVKILGDELQKIAR